jgi:hypothetical protein
VGVHEFNRENSQARTRCQRHRSLIEIDALTIPCVRHPVAEKPLLKKVQQIAESNQYALAAQNARFSARCFPGSSQLQRRTISNHTTQPAGGAFYKTTGT